jgi:hypothetical protein
MKREVKKITVSKLRANFARAIRDMEENKVMFEVYKHGRCIAKLQPLYYYAGDYLDHPDPKVRAEYRNQRRRDLYR